MTHEEFQKRFTYNPDTDRLGEGGFGEVFKVYDTVRDRWLALKVSKVRPELESVRLRKEVKMVNHLPEHQNIAFYEDCYTFRELSGEYDFGILQYYSEGNLLQLLKNNILSLSQKQSLLSQILDGLEFLHEQGIIHRDLKPQNILIVKRQNGEYVPKITDFGISKQLDINKSSVFSNSLAGAGTLAYASPEQLKGNEIRKNTDLWSFGVIAYQVFTGQLPFTAGEHASTSEAGRTELFRQINSGKLPIEINNISESWQTLIRRCLVIDPALRIKNEQEAKEILAGKKISTETGDTQIDPPPVLPKPIKLTPLPQPSEPDPEPNPTLKRNILIAVTATVIVLLLFFGWRMFFKDNNKNNQIATVTETPTEPAIKDSTNSSIPPPPMLEPKVAEYLNRAQSEFDNGQYDKAKISNSKALQLIPASNTTNIREVIKKDIAKCDEMIIQMKQKKEIVTPPVVVQKQPTQYRLTLSSNDLGYGTVSGAGTFNAGSSVTAVATPRSGCRFVNWTENGTPVSTSTNYTFPLNANRNLLANYEMIIISNPVPEEPVLVVASVAQLNPVFFGIDNNDVPQSQIPKIASAADFMKRNPSVRLTITGFDDSQTGTPSESMAKSQARAKNVASILINKYGISGNRLRIEWKGNGVQPFAQNEKNRVVIFTE